ncbi:MAG: SBBP repeat-containing protein [Bacteroidetes bacterium]|nr:SBBP repeat-containing protein [Bacteroidota bacterium]
MFYYTNAGNPQMYVGDGRLSYVTAHLHAPDDTVNTTDTLYRIDMSFISRGEYVYSKFKTYTSEKTEAFLNYFLGYLPEAITGVEGHSRIVQKNVYNGIDWQVHSSGEGMKSLLVIDPTVTFSTGALKYDGADSIIAEANKLRIYAGGSYISEDTLIAYQFDGDEKVYVDIAYEDLGDNEFGFELGDFDDGKNLVIEQRSGPRDIEHISSPDWSTYLGGLGSDEGTDLAVDGDGNVYVCGFTQSTDFPVNKGVSLGAFRFSAGGYDAFISKFGSANGATQGVVEDADRFLWATYWGGTSDEKSYGIKTIGNGTATGKVFITGYTESDDFPTFSNSGVYHQTALEGSRDAFIVGLDNARGGQLPLSRWATYFGGSGEETGRSITNDGSNNLFVGGYTSTNAYSSTSCDVPGDGEFPKCHPVGAYNSDGEGGATDGFIARFDPTGELTWSTFFGGIDDDYIYDIAMDGNSNLFVTGKTTGNLPITNNASIGAYNQGTIGGNEDAFLARFTSVGVNNWSTYFGGGGNDEARTIALDGNNNVYIGGSTSSSTPNSTLCEEPTSGGFPVCKSGTKYFQDNGIGAYIYGGGASDGFMAKLSAAGAFEWGTYYGGSGEDVINGLSVDFENRLFFSGQTNSTSSSYIYQPSSGIPWFYNEGSIRAFGYDDAFLGYFNSDNERIWATYYGGILSDKSNAIVVNSTSSDNHYWYIAGSTTSPNYKVATNWSDNFFTLCCSNAYRQLAPPVINSDAIMARFNFNEHWMVDVKDIYSSGLEVQVFPNPSSNTITIRLPNSITENVSFELLSITGQILKTSRASSNTALSYQMDLSDLTNGIYLLVINVGSQRTAKQIVKHD